MIQAYTHEGQGVLRHLYNPHASTKCHLYRVVICHTAGLIISMSDRTPEETQILKNFGDHLRAIRLARGLTQEELAHLAGFSRSYYTEIETGKRNISLLNLHRLAQCLHISLAELAGFDDAS